MTLDKFSGALKGQKTYVAAVLSALGAVAAYLTGEMHGSEAFEVITQAVLAFFLRRGMARETTATVEQVQNHTKNVIENVTITPDPR